MLVAFMVKAFTTLENLTTGMLGKKHNRFFAGKAAENAGILNITLELLDNHRKRMKHGDRLYEAGICLRDFLDTIRNAGRVLTQDQHQVSMMHVSVTLTRSHVVLGAAS